MSWAWNCTSATEAEEAYRYYAARYQEAVQEKGWLEKQENTYKAQRAQLKTSISTNKQQKVNLEKRVRDIDSILSMLEGRSFLNDVPKEVSQANSTLKEAEASYCGCIKIDGQNQGHFGEFYSTESVNQNVYSQRAVEIYKAKKKTLECQIQELDKNIKSMSQTVEELNGQIRTCVVGQFSRKSRIASSAYNASHYKSCWQQFG